MKEESTFGINRKKWGFAGGISTVGSESVELMRYDR